MYLKTRSWFLISLLCFILAGYFWHLGNQRYRRDEAARALKTEPPMAPIKELGANNFRHAAPSLLAPTNELGTRNSELGTNVLRPSSLLTNRLSNTTKSLKELMHSDSAVLLRNALIDTSVTDGLNIPANLRSKGAPGSYVVQANGDISSAFRAQLKAAGATIISYIPNNAYLVQLSEAGASQMRAAPQTLSVLPWEPYYKLDLRLLAMAVQSQPLPDNAQLNVLVFPGEREAGIKALTNLGAKVLGEDRSPFGNQLIVSFPAAQVPLAHPMGEGSGERASLLPAIAALPLVQTIEIHHPRQLVNDLTRPRVGVSTNSYSPPPDYLGLDGTGVLVAMADSGIDAGHPDFDTRVTGDTSAAIIDYDGHGTHVAGTIAGSGSMSSTVAKRPQGSSTNGWDFRGMAPKAKLFAQQIDLLLGPIVSDAYLQETAAMTNAFIHNDSWGYVDSLDYDSAAALYDDSTRNAIPGRSGPEPILFVFAAGNSGGGGPEGQGGQPESISSPATAKNVLTVGAIEKARGITNLVVADDGSTNTAFYGQTDSDDQVAYFSSRGNVGVGVEGIAGRFKPDLVAPGEFDISCRANNWKDPSGTGEVIVNRKRNEIVQPFQTNLYDILIPGNATSLSIITRSNSLSPDPFPSLPIYARAGAAPNLTNDFVGNGSVNIPVTPGQWFFAVGNTNGAAVNFDLITVIFIQNTNSGNYFLVLSNLNNELKPWYRFESGTSQSAPAVSGILALMQQFFQQKLNLSPTNNENWPALMKALLINGANSLGESYNRQVQTALNLQGWGVASLTNSIPPAMNGGIGSEATWPIAFFHTNSLYTGQSHTRTLTVKNPARIYPLRITLVWTDPPGNPAASIKLVNDLDLIVTNTVSGTNKFVYFGNNISQGSDFSDVSDPADTNAPPLDIVNNVENVFINSPVGTNYTITVKARRVNVNAVTGQTNGVLQDYALVISSGNPALTNAFTVTDISTVPQVPDDLSVVLKPLTNGVPLLHQRVGANNPEITVINNGITNQWSFYVYNNTNSSLTNVAFLTFLAPNLSRNRYLDADIDLYVSPSAQLTNLDAAVVADAIANGPLGGRSARSRGGTEIILFTNAIQFGTTFYIGVKSEDQQAAEFALYAIASNGFGQRDANGNIPLTFSPLPAEIPDGSPEDPQAVQMIAIVADPANVRRLILTNTITHENGGDLFGIITHPSSPAHSSVLNNHRSFVGTETFIYDDSRENDVPGSQVPDGPGHLRDFMGDPITGAWILTMIDNSPFHTGRVETIIGSIEPDDVTNQNGILLTAAPQSWKYASVDVPANVTNLIVFLTEKGVNIGPLGLYLLLGDFPTALNYDAMTTIIPPPPAGSLSYGVNDSPGLQPGNRYYIGVFNGNSFPVTFNLRVEFQYGLNEIASQTYLSPDTPKGLLDDAVTNSFITVTNNRVVADVQVGIRIDHPRVSDLVVHLVSPQGTRILLTENRGGPEFTNYGFGQPVDFGVGISYSANNNAEFRTNIDATVRSGILRVDYNFIYLADDLRVYFDGKRIFDSGSVSNTTDPFGTGTPATFSIPFGPGLSTILTLVVNEGGGIYTNTGWNINAQVTGPWNYTTFTDNANLGGPVKFGLPPYFIIPTNRTVMTSSFELVNSLTNQTNFSQSGPSAFDSWQVLTNGVAILSDTNHPYEALNLGSTNWGTNYLALSSGWASLPLTNVIPDRDYILTFAQRKVSSSPPQSIDLLIDPTANIFQHLNVTNLPDPNASDAPWAKKVRLCPGQQVLILATNSANTNIAPYAQGLTNSLFAGLPLYGLVGCFGFTSETLTSNTVATVPFYIGSSNVITAPSEPGDYYLFLGINNNDYNSNTNIPPDGEYHVTVSWQQCQYASGEVDLGANSFPIVGTANWSVESHRFLANPTMTNLVLKPDINTTLLFDAFQIDELVSTLFYQSEEPMTPLLGQLAAGKWKLEVWDNRSGPISMSSGGTGNVTNDTGTLFSWSLRFVFADGPTAIPLTNGVPYTNVVRGNQIKYFIVAVPKEVTIATNYLVSSGPGAAGVELLYSPLGLPLGQSPPDPLPAIPEGATPFAISTTFPPAGTLPQGSFYYLGVRNANPAEVNNFTIRAEFNIPVTPLFNGVQRGNEFAPSNTFSFAFLRDQPSFAITNVMTYYYFDIVSTNVVSASFRVVTEQTAQAPADVNLVLRRALPVVDLFPHPTFFDYESTQPAYGNELIIVNSNSLPVQLTPGRWYLGVYSTGTNYGLSHFSIVANSSVSPLWTYVDLTNAIPVPFSINSLAAPATNFYRFVVDQNNSGVLFEIFGLSQDADLLVKRGDLPALDLNDFTFLQEIDPVTFAGATETIRITTNVFVPDLNATNWFLQVLTPNGTVAGWICAKVADPSNMLPACDTPVIGSPSISPGGPFSFAWNSVPGEKYAVEETVNLKTWTTNEVIKATQTKTSFSAPASSAGPPHFYRVKQIPP